MEDAVALLHHFVGNDSDTITWWQMGVRAGVIFPYGIFLVRLARGRIFGGITPLDIVLAVILGSVLSRVLTANAPLLPSLFATAVLVALHTLVAWGASHLSWIGRVVKGREARLIRDGAVDREALSRHFLTEHELIEALRLRGRVEDPALVKGAWLERSGQISVIPRDRDRVG